MQAVNTEKTFQVYKRWIHEGLIFNKIYYKNHYVEVPIIKIIK